MFAFAVVALASALAASAANFTVAVGDNNQVSSHPGPQHTKKTTDSTLQQLTFSPSQVNAQIGDIINFEL